MCSARISDNNALQWSRGFGGARLQVAVVVSRREGGDGSSLSHLKAGLIFGRSQPKPAFGGAKAATKVLTGILGLPARPRLVGLTYCKSGAPLKKKFRPCGALGAGEGRPVAAAFSRSPPPQNPTSVCSHSSLKNEQ